VSQQGLGGPELHGSVWRVVKAFGVRRNRGHRRLSLWASHAWRHSRSRTVHNAGRGYSFHSHHRVQSVPDEDHHAIYVVDAVIELKDVVKSYGDKLVLDGVSFRVYRGETKIIIGASGSGKSTILKLIMALEEPDEGHILVEGTDVTKLRERDLPAVRQK